MFEAVYGGRWVAPPICGDEAYLQLRQNCEKMLRNLDPDWITGLTNQVYFPDHIESRGEMDMLLDDWQIGERAYVKQLLSQLTKLVLERCASVSEDLRQVLLKQFNLLRVDEANRKVQEERIRLDQAFDRHLATPP